MPYQHLTGLDQISATQLTEVLELSAKIKADPDAYRTRLAGKSLAMIFQKPSTRTRVSFQVGIYQLGGQALVMGQNDLQLGRGETLADTARVLSRYVHGIMARVFAHDDVVQLAEHATVPVINGLSDLLHPCQAVCDYLTMREHLGSLAGLRVAYLGDGNNVAHSLAYGAARLGVSLVIATPGGRYAPDEAVIARAREDAKETGASIEVVTDAKEAVGGARWSPLRRRGVLLPGDLVRTPARGANAIEIQLAAGGKLLLGPGGLVEVVAGDRLRLSTGDLEVRGAPGHAVTCFGPGGFEQAVGEPLVLRAGRDGTRVLTEAPRWLSGYRASTTNEWMGSLVAQVDGRAVPLAVGSHQVDVVVRDQIAQTTVEQTFVNSTDSQLEGTFSFPLPADASISGFGMWVGNELVEADIVEKQRARQIFEDILRRKKDPGLLEWSGGNLFKARVFPIPPQGHKRIRIRYTQVLPLEGTTLRYRYALRSDLLRQHPVDELRIAVHVHSSAAIAAASSPTHSVRTRRSAHTATIEFDAETFTPARDFEATVELAQRDPLTAVAHRRGDDGYFMLLLSPPDEGGSAWKRELLPDGEPLDLVLMADTSGSMDGAARRAQSDFIAALLQLLGPDDRFRLMTCDVAANWWRPEPAAADAGTIAAALAFLEQRPVPRMDRSGHRLRRRGRCGRRRRHGALHR